MKALLIPIIAALALCAGTQALAVGSEFEPLSTESLNPDYTAGKKAVESSNWKVALDHFHREAIRDPRNANVHNFIGYAYRKSGNLNLAFKHYHEALRLDPRHRGAHEYIGEAYLMTGDVTKAEEHLTALDNLCWFSCEEYRDLKRAIEEYKRAKK